MSPALIEFVIMSGIRLYRGGSAAYEQYVRDKEVLFPQADSMPWNDRQIVLMTYQDLDEFQELVKPDAEYAGYWDQSPPGSPVDDQAVAILYAEIVRRLKVGRPDDEADNLSRNQKELAAGGFLVEQWAKGKGPAHPAVHIAIALVDVGAAFVATKPSVMGIGGNGEKLVRAMAQNLTDLIPDDVEAYSSKAVLTERMLAIFLRSALSALDEHSEDIIGEDHFVEIIQKSLKPIIKEIPTDLTIDEQVKWEKVISAVTGPAAQAAVGVIATHPEKFLGGKFKTEKAVGALTQAMLKKAAENPFDENFSQAGLLAILKSALALAADRPELIMGKPDNETEQFKLDLFSKVVGVLKEADPPFNGDLGADIAVAALDALGENATKLLDVDEDWDDVVKSVTDSVIGGFQASLTKGNTDALEKLFTRSQFKSWLRVLMTEMSKTPGMLVGGKKEIKNLVAAVGAAMAADENLLLSAENWTQILKVAAEEAAANPGALFGLDETAPGDALLSGLIMTVLSTASQSMPSGSRKEGAVLFGSTLVETIGVTIRGAAGQAIKAASSKEKLKSLLAEIESYKKLVSVTDASGQVTQSNQKLGSKEWLRVYRVLYGRLLRNDNFTLPPATEIEGILSGRITS